MPLASERRVRPAAPAPTHNSCPELISEQTVATHRVADAIESLAGAVREGTIAFQPAADTVAGAGQRLDALCSFLAKKGPWLLASVPAVLLAIGAISPNAAAGLKAGIAALGGTP